MQSGGSYYGTNARNRFGKLLGFLCAHEFRVTDGDVARVVTLGSVTCCVRIVSMFLLATYFDPADRVTCKFCSLHN